MRTVGILGGMGPEATVDLMRRIIAATPAQDDAGHVPLIVDQNPQVPSRIAHLIDGTGADPGPVLAAMARRLEAAGAQALAMPCNTAHHYAAAITGAVGVPFLDMVDLSVAAARDTGAGTVAILASPAVRIAGIFDAALAAQGLRAVYPADQDALLRAIRIVKSSGATDAARSLLHDAALGVPAPVHLIACTEFSLLADALPDHLTCIDTLDVLTRAITAFATGA